MVIIGKLQFLEGLRRQKKICFVCSVFIIILVIWYFVYWETDNIIKRSFNGKQYDADKILYTEQDTKFIGEKLVHLDLKGAPPRVSYYEKLFPILSTLGASGLLIEYEDMFPYQGFIRNISALNCYTHEDIKIINNLAEKSNLEIIPLVQTFGHMEFILKLEEFKELREVPEYPQVICPTHGKTIKLIAEMVYQILQAHPKSNKIHIGADEVWYIGMCDRCINTMNEFGWMKNQLFTGHIKAVASKIRIKYPKIRILMWDDEFRGMSERELKASNINNFVEPVVWKYTKDVYDDLGPSLWDLYMEVFPKIWIGSAFKGATGSDQYITDVTHHLQNHRSWMSVVAEYKERINFQGIFITGWQRYDHFAVLCELFPVSLPSLAMSLRLLLGYNDSPLSPPTEIAKQLQCEQPYALIGPTFGSPKCEYPGGEILEIIYQFHELKQEFLNLMEDSKVKGWMSDYNIDHGFSNNYYIESAMTSLTALKVELSQVEIEMAAAMQVVYDNYTITEWRETFIKPFAKQIKRLWDAREKLLAKEHWPRRPLMDSCDNED